MRILGGLLVVLLLTGCGGTSPPSGHPQRQEQSSSPTTTSAGPAHLTSARCADLVVLGLRGQGQPRHGHHGAGRDVDGVARSMLDHLPRGTTVRIDGVPFPARSGGDATYSEDVRSGVRLVRDRLATLDERCQGSRAVLIGYSQGAEVVHRSAVALDDPARVAVVVLMGDPVRNPGDGVTTLRLGAGTLSGQGNGGLGTWFPDEIRPRVLEVCAPGDDVCNAPPAGRLGPPSATHRSIYKRRAPRRLVGVETAKIVVGSGG